MEKYDQSTGNTEGNRNCFEMSRMMDFANKDFKVANLNISRELKETMLK